MTLDPKRKFFITLGGAILLPVLVIGAFVYPFFGALQKSAEDLVAARKEFSTLIERQKQLGELESGYREHKELLQEIEGALYEKETDDLDFILLVEDIAKKTGNKHILAPPQYYDGGVDSLPYFTSSLALEGTFDELLRFIRLFHTMKFYSDIDALAIRASTKGVAIPGLAPLLDAAISFKVFTK